MKLNVFYASDKWRNLLEILKQQRVGEDGFLRCEECGQPILKKYDCIGHHIEPLTEENAEDATVSLNPENIKLIHFKCHNKIHERWQGFQKGWKQNVYLVYGSPCSGKTTFVNENANGDDLILDVDRLWDAVCKDGQSKKPPRCRANVFALRDSLLDQIKTRTGKWRCAYVIGGFPLANERARLCDLLNATEVFVEATEEECIRRAERERPEGWTEFIQNWFESYSPTLPR